MFWRLYFWFITITYVISLGWDIYNWHCNIWDILDYLICFFGLIPLFGFTYNKEVMTKNIWKAYLPILVIWEVVFSFVLDEALKGTGLWVAIGLYIFMLLLVGPLYRGIYLYGYRGLTLKDISDAQPKNLLKKVVIGFLLVIFTIVTTSIIAFVIVTKGHEGGIHYTSTMEPYAKEYLKNHELIGESEKVIAYMDDSLYLDGTDAIILTEHKIMYHYDNDTYKTNLEDVKEISKYEEDFFYYIEVLDKNNESLHVPFTFESEANVFYKALKKQLQLKKINYLEIKDK